jgi:putative ABC transport system permease protein
VTGIVASSVGLVLGYGVAFALRALVSVLGFELPEGSPVVSTGSLLVAFGLGVGATIVSAIAPSRAAGRVPPIAALRGLSVEVVGATRRRLTIGTVASGGGVALLLGSAGRSLALVGVGAAMILVGTAVLGPVFVRPAARVFGVPFSLTGVSGELAVQNGIRNPKRTARTASSLMIGVALVAFMSVFGASMTSSFGSSLDRNFFGTHVIESGGGFRPELADEMRTTAGIEVVSEFRYSPARVNDEPGTTDLEAYDASTIGQLLELGQVEGELGELGADGIAIDREYADEHDLRLGARIPVVFPTGPTVATVRAIFDASEWIGSQFMDTSAFDEHLPRGLVYRVYASGDIDAIRTVTERFPTAEVLDRKAFLDTVSSTIDQFLAVITVLLALAVLIALLGVANTLSLAVYERTREIGLLRAIGMTRRQLRAVLRIEAIHVALLGTGLGIGVGTLVGWAIVRTLEDQGFDTMTVPGVRLAIIAAVGATAGAVVATLPARRAARLDVLDALAST